MPNLATVTAPNIVRVEWDVPSLIGVGAVSYTFDHARILVTSPDGITVHSDSTDNSTSGSKSGIDVSAEPGPIRQVFARVIATYTAAGYPNHEIEPVSMLVFVTPPFAPLVTSPRDLLFHDPSLSLDGSASFSSAVSGDRVSGYEVRWTTDNGTTWASSGFIAAADLDQIALFAPSTFADGDEVEWQLAAYGRNGARSVWSPSRMMTMQDPPSAPTILTPSPGDPVGHQVAFTLQDQLHRDGLEVRRVADNAASPDSSVVYWAQMLPGGQSITVVVPFDVSGRWEHIQARQSVRGIWGDWASVLVFASFSRPAAPILTVETIDARAMMLLHIVNPAPGPSQVPTETNVIRARRCGIDEVEWQTVAAPGELVKFWTPASGVEYEFQVEALPASGGPTATGWIR